MRLVDILIHVNKPLEEKQRHMLEDNLRQLNGVIAPRFNKETPHLLFVSYDSLKTTSQKLLNHIQKNHYPAQLIGM